LLEKGNPKKPVNDKVSADTPESWLVMPDPKDYFQLKSINNVVDTREKNFEKQMGILSQKLQDIRNSTVKELNVEREFRKEVREYKERLLKDIATEQSNHKKEISSLQHSHQKQVNHLKSEERDCKKEIQDLISAMQKQHTKLSKLKEKSSKNESEIVPLKVRVKVTRELQVFSEIN